MGAPPMNTLPARVVAQADRLTAVIGNGETCLTLPAMTARMRRYIDRDVVIGIRPECIAEHTRHFGDSTASIEAPVDMTEPTGAETIVLLQLAGQEALARIAPDIRLRPGERARFSVDTRKICLFDPATEQLIG
jgi:multiple sugar transport system ATP-binding protein